MNQFVFQQHTSPELEQFPHVSEFSLAKNTTIQLDSFTPKVADCLCIDLVVDGKFEWIVNDQEYMLFPGDMAFVLPGRSFGGVRGVLGIGALFRLHILIEKTQQHSLSLGSWSCISPYERPFIESRLLADTIPVLSKIKEGPEIMHQIHAELTSPEIGHITRVNHLIDSLLILIARHSTRQSQVSRDFPRNFMKLEQALRRDLAHQWTVEEMAALFGLGSTAFTERVKYYTGFSPLNYLINIRISEAIYLLKQQDISFTDIALETGFYSSQHFSTTFKKLTGYTPGQFRKRIVASDPV